MKKLYILTLFATLFLAPLHSQSSVRDIKKEAKADNYQLNESGATEKYLLAIDQLIASGDAKRGKKEAENLMKEAKKNDALDTRLQALSLYIKADSLNATSIARDALKDDCPAYRLAALKLAANYDKGGEIYRNIISLFLKEKDSRKASIADWIASDAKDADKRWKMQAMVAPLAEGLKTKDLVVKRSITEALAALQYKEGIAPLMQLLVYGNAESVAIAAGALAQFGDEVCDPLAKNLVISNDTAKIAIIHLLRQKKSSKHLGEIISLTSTGSEDVKVAAYNALKYVVVGKDVNTISNILQHADSIYTVPLQEALSASLDFLPKEERFETIYKKFTEVPNDKKQLFYPILVATEKEVGVKKVSKR